LSAAANATDYRALLARQEWGPLRKKLKLWAWKATGSRSMDRAEDLVQDAVARLWQDAGVRWDPQIEPNLFRFMTGLIRGDLSNERRLKATSSEVLAPNKASDRDDDKDRREDDERQKPIEAYGDGGQGSAEALLVQRERLHRGFAALRERTADDEQGATVAALFESGVSDAAEQAAASGYSIDDIRRARRRVFDHAAAIGRERAQEREEDEEERP
jgi:DNA-directed RNA polymerase specialized sigma24 family protein